MGGGGAGHTCMHGVRIRGQIPGHGGAARVCVVKCAAARPLRREIPGYGIPDSGGGCWPWRSGAGALRSSVLLLARCSLGWEHPANDSVSWVKEIVVGGA